MRWIGWLRRSVQTDDPTVAALDIEQVLSMGLRDPASARQSIARLKRARKILVRRRKSIERSLRPLSRGRTGMIAFSTFSNPQNTELGTYQLSQAMRDANATGHLVSQRKDQIAAIDGRIQAIDRTLPRLDAYSQQAR